MSSATIRSVSTTRCNTLPKGYAAPGALKIKTIGCWISSFEKIPPKFVNTVPQTIWLSSVPSPSIALVIAPVLFFLAGRVIF